MIEPTFLPLFLSFTTTTRPLKKVPQPISPRKKLIDDVYHLSRRQHEALSESQNVQRRQGAWAKQSAGCGGTLCCFFKQYSSRHKEACVSQPASWRWRLRPQSTISRTPTAAFALSYHGLNIVSRFGLFRMPTGHRNIWSLRLINCLLDWTATNKGSGFTVKGNEKKREKKTVYKKLFRNFLIDLIWVLILW